ncbi:hypothetical protein e1116g03.tmp0151 [Eimeria tenella]|uniref:Uncharacterized protein n=1 Tax=Eimeria tenella TaxID=5802 RepID=C8TE48_EIMTE|nr:hypothetical protein e1116g03.tmp0151 [Eimeria tenella]
MEDPFQYTVEVWPYVLKIAKHSGWRTLSNIQWVRLHAITSRQRLQEDVFKSMINGAYVYPEASLWAGILNVSSNKLDVNGASRSETLHHLLEIPCSAFALAGY